MLRCSTRNAARRRWTGDEEQLLLKLAGEGVSRTAVAEKLGRNKGMIESKLKRLRNPLYKKWEGKVTHGYRGYRALARQVMSMLPDNSGSARDVFDVVEKMSVYYSLPRHATSGGRSPVWQTTLSKYLSCYPEFVSSHRNERGRAVYTYSPELVSTLGLGPGTARKRKAEGGMGRAAKRRALDFAKAFRK
jgi:hypothetical protein